MLTKSNFMRFLECSCQLWLLKQRPDLLLQEEDKALQRILDEGNVVDQWAKKLFPGGVEIEGYNHVGARNTKKAIDGGATVLFQPTFVAGELACRCDILLKNEDGSWDIYEVKSSTAPKDEHVFDVAFQRICLEGAGVRVSRTFIVHINNSYVRNGDIEPKKLFTATEITHEVNGTMTIARKEIAKALEVVAWDKQPTLQLLASCRDPHECEFLPHYWHELTDDHIYSIGSSLSEERLRAFLKRGLLKPEQIPEDRLAELKHIELPDDESAAPVLNIDKAAMSEELNGLRYPLYFLDYETFFPAVPLFDGYRPYQHAVFQYSVHVLERPDGELKDYCFIVEDLADPAPKLAESLKEHIGATGSIIVWNARFEASRNEEIAVMLPEHAEFFRSVNERMFDLMLMVKKGYYVDSRFGGSASIKKVLPVVVPELSYKSLAIQEGGTASASWAELTNPATSPERKAQLKQDMLKYCGLDTLAMVEIYKKFRQVATK